MLLDNLLVLLVTKENTSYEYQLAYYFIQHCHQILNLSQKQVLEETFVSKSTLFRFCRYVGYNNYTDFQHHLDYISKGWQKSKNAQHYYPIPTDVQNSLKGKKRIIVYGDYLFLGHLLPYKKLYIQQGIELYFKLIPKTWEQLIGEIELSERDAFIHLMLSDSFFEWQVKDFHASVKMRNVLNERNIPIIMMGKFSHYTNNDNNTNYIHIEVDDNLSKKSEILSLIFENLLTYL